MAQRTYRQWALDNSPPWLLGTWGTKLVSAIGVMFDDARSSIYQAGAAGSLDAPTFPADALALMGSERNIERYPAETDDEYHLRVKGAWESWAQAGTMRLVAELDYLGFTAEIKEIFSDDWDWDGDTDNWSRIWVVITQDDWGSIAWGSGGTAWGTGVWGCDATQSEAATLLRLIRKWKPGHVVPITIIVMDAGTWATEQPDGTWDDPGNRSASALYHFER
jgi:hypothetical protein